MGRAPCCEKMGLNKGSWTPQEDKILVHYIQNFGHSNWRALPKQAGLLRCGKSCRLRWLNYLRPDIKRGNFTKEEEDTIISLHEMLGNRWSAIAAKLPGRTDNEIKNVWNTHLKNRKNCEVDTGKPKKRTRSQSKSKKVSEPMTAQTDTDSTNTKCANSSLNSISTDQSYSELSLSSFVSDSSTTTPEVTESNAHIKPESFSSQQFTFDEAFWTEALSMNSYRDNSNNYENSFTDAEDLASLSLGNYSDKEFWVKVFRDAGGDEDLKEMWEF